jgi:hypothetical protein
MGRVRVRTLRAFGDQICERIISEGRYRAMDEAMVCTSDLGLRLLQAVVCSKESIVTVQREAALRRQTMTNNGSRGLWWRREVDALTSTRS